MPHPFKVHSTPITALRKELQPRAVEQLWSAFNYGDYKGFTAVVVEAATSIGVISKDGPVDLLETINSQAYEWALNHSAELVVGISDEQQAALQALVSHAIRLGWSDSRLAQAVQKTVGLTDDLTDSVANYEKTLISQGKDRSQANTLSDAYADQLRYNRAKSIAETEISAALNEGQRIVWRDAADDGQLPDNVRRQAMLDPSERTCETCVNLNGTVTTLDSGFGPNADLEPPFHPSCNCTEQLIDLNNQVVG